MFQTTLIVSPKAKGNTHKVAAYLAKTAGADLLILENKEERPLEQYERIVLCSGVYGDRLHPDLVSWLKSLEKDRLRQEIRFHVFLTWFGRGQSDRNAMEQAQSLLAEQGLPCDPDYGSCFGGMLFLRKGHPDAKDLTLALRWLLRKS